VQWKAKAFAAVTHLAFARSQLIRGGISGFIKKMLIKTALFKRIRQFFIEIISKYYGIVAVLKSV